MDFARARRAEHEVLLCCDEAFTDPAPISRVDALLRGHIDWQYLCDVAARHGVTPLVLRTLTRAVPGAVPRHVHDHLVARCTATALHTRFLARRLGEIVRLLETEGIRALAFKGPVLSVMAYGDLSLREFSDLDLLVAPEQFAAARQVLLRHGYRFAADHGWEETFLAQDQVCVDLHHGLAARAFPLPVDFGRWWSRRQSVDLDGDGRAVTALAREDLLVVLTIQAARDSWDGKLRLAKICDIARTMSGANGVRWSVVDDESRRLRTRGILTFGVLLAADLLRTPIAEDAARVLAPNRAIRSVVTQESRGLFDEPGETNSTKLRGALLHFRLREHLRDKMAPFCVDGARRLLTPNERDRAVLPLPRWLSALYYVIRPIRVAWHNRLFG